MPAQTMFYTLAENMAKYWYAITLFKLSKICVQLLEGVLRGARVGVQGRCALVWGFGGNAPKTDDVRDVWVSEPR